MTVSVNFSPSIVVGDRFEIYYDNIFIAGSSAQLSQTGVTTLSIVYGFAARSAIRVRLISENGTPIVINGDITNSVVLTVVRVA